MNNDTKKGLSTSLRRFFGIGDAAFTLMTLVENVYFNFFLTNIAMFNLGIITMIQTTTTAIDAATSWMYGAIMNGTKPMKWGRYRSWLLITPWLVPLIYMMKYVVVGENQTIAAWIIIAAGVISSIIWNFGYVANMALIAVVGKTPAERAQLSASRGTYNRAATMLFSYMGLPLANLLAMIVTEQYKFAALAFVFAVMAAIGYNIHFKLTEGYEELPKDAALEGKEAVKKEKTSAGAMFKALFANTHLIFLLVAEFTRWSTNFIVSGCAVYYFTYVAQNMALLPTYLLITSILCTAGAYTSKYLAVKMGTKQAFVFSFLLFGACLVTARLCYTSTWAVIGLMALGQYGYGCIYSLSAPMFADASIYAEYKTGENSSGWIMGLGNVPLKVALIVRGLIINGVLIAAGFSAQTAVEATTIAVKEAIANIFLLIPGAGLIAGGLLILFGFRLTRETVEQMSSEIELRKIKINN